MNKIISRCGLICSDCDYREKFNCPTCHESNENPFWGECKVAKCSISRNLNNCSECEDFACELLTEFAFDKEHGDNGERIENLKNLKIVKG
jgi:hypothetical protein